jgi:hypothetical protein
MVQKNRTNDLAWYGEAWKTLENLIDPDPIIRDKGLEDLEGLEGFQAHPLILYVLATRILDPDLEIRFHAVQALGKLLELNADDGGLPERSFKTVTDFTTQIDKEELIKLLEVSVQYLAAEKALVRILKLCSYAGKALGGIVNDRTLPVEIRQQAIHFCGEVGFLSSVTGIRNLIQRVEKNKTKAGKLISRKKYLDEESLIPYAVTALGKLAVE